MVIQIYKCIVIASILPGLVSAVQYAKYKCAVNNTHSAIELFVYKDTESVLKVYAEGFESSCSATGTGTLLDPFMIVVQLDPSGTTTTADQTACGVKAQGGQKYELRALTQSLDRAFKATDQRYKVSCDPTAPVKHDSQTRLIAVDQQSSVIDQTTTEITETVSLNVIDYSTDQILRVVNFRQMVRLQVVLTPVIAAANGVRVTSCMAVGGLLSGAPQLPLIKDGCGDNETGIISETLGFESNGIDHTVGISPPFQMFIFTDIQLPVIFACRVEFCYDGDDCSRTCNPGTGRRKRDAGLSGSKEVATGVTVTVSAEAKSNAQEDVICSDWPYVVSLASVSFVLLLTLAFVMWLYSEMRNGKKQ